MKKEMKILLIGIIIISVIIAATGFMFIFKLCPPDGPWPLPPWCENRAKIPFEPRQLDYITESYPPTDMNLMLGIGTFDIWGNPHLWIDLGDITQNNVDNTMERIGTIGSEIFMITDFLRWHNDGSITYPAKEDSPGSTHMTQAELDNIVSKAKQNNQKVIILMTNLVSTKEDLEYIEQGFDESEGMAGEKIALQQAKKQFVDNTGEQSSGEVILSFTEAQKEELLETWKARMIDQAKKAEKAGVTHLLINPRHVSFEYRLDSSFLDQKYADLVPELRKHFSGKIGIWGNLDAISDYDYDNFDFIQVEFDPNWGIADKMFKDIPDRDVDAMKTKFDEYFRLEQWNALKGKELYMQCTISSIQNGLELGWLGKEAFSDKSIVDQKEQALAYEAMFRSLYEYNPGLDGVISYGYWWTDQLYPTTRVLRNDLMHTIRSKDAEQVFYKWSQTFD